MHNLISRLPVMRVDSVVVGVDLLHKVGVHLIEHLLDQILARLLLPMVAGGQFICNVRSPQGG